MRKFAVSAVAFVGLLAGAHGTAAADPPALDTARVEYGPPEYRNPDGGPVMVPQLRVLGVRPGKYTGDWAFPSGIIRLVLDAEPGMEHNLRCYGITWNNVNDIEGMKPGKVYRLRVYAGRPGKKARPAKYTCAVATVVPNIEPPADCVLIPGVGYGCVDEDGTPYSIGFNGQLDSKWVDVKVPAKKVRG